MLKTIMLGIAGMLLLGGCTAKLTEPAMNFEPPAYVEQMPSMEVEEDFASTGSIFGQGDNPLFSDHKAMHVNDIVTVVISETAQSSNSANKATSKSDNSALGGGVFSNAGGNPTVSSALNYVNGLTDIGFQSGSSSTYAGQGSYSKDASFTTTISARIVKVLQNGNYFITGQREIMIDEEKQYIQISGVIRPYDIDQNNQINSTQIADAKIAYSTQGDIQRSISQGWGTKLVQAVWPF